MLPNAQATSVQARIRTRTVRTTHLLRTERAVRARARGGECTTHIAHVRVALGRVDRDSRRRRRDSRRFDGDVSQRMK